MLTTPIRESADATGPAQAVSRVRPLARRAAMIARPARVRIRSRKPCVLARRRLFGWKVRLLTGNLQGRAAAGSEIGRHVATAAVVRHQREGRPHRPSCDDRSTVRSAAPAGQTHEWRGYCRVVDNGCPERAYLVSVPRAGCFVLLLSCAAVRPAGLPCGGGFSAWFRPRSPDRLPQPVDSDVEKSWVEPSNPGQTGATDGGLPRD
jgi:hypothetical protein